MRVKMLTLSAGPSGVRKPGMEIDVPQAEGEALVKGHYAVPVSAAAAETATNPPPETRPDHPPQKRPPQTPPDAPPAAVRDPRERVKRRRS